MDDLFEKFMQDNYRLFIAFCIARRKSHNDADDIVNEAFVRLHKKWPERCGIAEAYNKKWMYNAICFIIKEFERDDKRYKAENIDDYAEILSEESDLEKKERYEDLIEALEEGLSDGERNLFKLVFIEKKPYPQICSILGINDQALRTRISRLRKRLQENFKKKF